MNIQAAVHANRCAHWNQKFNDALDDNRIRFISLTIISAFGTLLLMQGFLSPARDVDSKEVTQISYRDISPTALATSITSLIYLWPIGMLIRGPNRLTEDMRCLSLFFGIFLGAIFPVYRLLFCLHTTSPPLETMNAVDACKQYFTENQDKIFQSDCIIHPLEDYPSLCEVTFDQLPQEITDCIPSAIWETIQVDYTVMAPYDQYHKYEKCLPTSQFMTSDITQYSILAMNGALILLCLMKLGQQLKNCSKKRHQYETINA